MRSPLPCCLFPRLPLLFPRAAAGLPALLLLSLAVFPARPAAASGVEASRPNVVLLYADDLGVGDVGCYGAVGLKTPNMDRLAREGLRFTDAHSAAATCTPSRYALLTGEYAWRRKGTGILPGDAALIIAPGRATLPGLFQKAGYATGVVGKWHLGLGSGAIDWNAEIRPGPLEIGFAESFIMAATGDRVPSVYLEGHRVRGLDPADPLTVSYREKVGGEPTGVENPELLTMRSSHGHNQTLHNGIGRIGYMAGGKSARWRDEDLGDEFTARAVGFLERHRDRPFFLYYAAHEPHVPRRPHPRFEGKSGLGLRGDAILALDWSVGEILHALDRLGLAERTLVILTSDNGAVADDGYEDGAVERMGAHRPSGPWRGGKYSPYEGGTRVPALVRWPGRVRAGETSAALVCQVDLPASCAALLGEKLPEGAAPDSRNLLPALPGDSPEGREELVEQSASGRLSLREGAWKYIPAGEAGAYPGGEGDAEKPAQLYDLASDPEETRNLAAEPQHLERAASMRGRLDALRAGYPR